MYKPEQVEVPLLSCDQVGPVHYILTFEYEEPLKAKPGHFAMVRVAQWGNLPFLSRPMSLLSAGQHTTMLVKVVGEGSSRFAASKPGDLFSILAPLGQPWSDCPTDQVPILVAGGVGVAPLLFLAREMAKQGRKILALYGGRSISELPLHKDLGDLSDLRIATEDGSAGQRGPITMLLGSALAETGDKAKVYTCGPRAMMAHIVRECHFHNIPCEVSLETLMACGYGACLGCAMPKASGGYLYACTNGACINSRIVDWGN